MKLKQSTHLKNQSEKKSHLRENIEALLVAILLALLIRTFVIQAFKIPSGSMEETLQIGDHILVNKFIYGVKVPFFKDPMISIKEPVHGDIIVFKYPKDPSLDYIKRVIAVGGDTIEIRNKKVYINNKMVDSSFAIFSQSSMMAHGDNFGPVTVPENSLFVMGDNRDNSLDSRYWGFVDLSAVRGKAFMVYWSWNSKIDQMKFWNRPRWGRIGNLIR